MTLHGVTPGTAAAAAAGPGRRQEAGAAAAAAAARVNVAIEDAFESLGKFTARRSWLVLGSVLVVCICFMGGLANIKYEDDVYELWINDNSRLRPERRFLADEFGEVRSRSNFSYGVAPDGESMLTEARMQQWLEFQVALTTGLQVVRGDTTYGWNDVCDRIYSPFVDLPCTKFTVMDCFSEGDYDFFLPPVPGLPPNPYPAKPSFTGATDAAIAAAADGTCTDWAGIPVPQNFVMGGIERADNGTVATVSSLQFILEVGSIKALAQRMTGESSPDSAALDAAESVILEFEQQFLERSAAFSPGVDFDIHFWAKRTENDLNRAAGEGDAPLLIAGYVMMIAFACAAMARRRHADSRSLTACVGVLLVCVAVFAALGFTAAVGVTFTAMHLQVIPFLALGLGVDDLFVMLFGYRRADSRPVEDLVGACMRESGVSVTLTSAVNFIAFMIGYNMPLPNASLFSVSAAFVVMFNYLVVVLAFPAVLAIDERRARAGRADCLFCVRHKQAPVADGAAVKGRSAAAAGKGDVEAAPALRSAADRPSSHPGSPRSAAGSRPGTPDPGSPRAPPSPMLASGRFAKPLWAAPPVAGAASTRKPRPANERAGLACGRALMRPTARVLVLGATAGLLGAAAWGTTQLETGLELSDIVPDDHYSAGFFATQEASYEDYEGNLVTGFRGGRPVEVDYPNALADILAAQDALQGAAYVNPAIPIAVVSWANNFIAYVADERPSNLTAEGLPKPELFYPLLGEWLQTATGVSFVPRFSFGEDGLIRSTTIRYFATGLSDIPSMLDHIESCRAAVDAQPFPCFPAGFVFDMYEQYLGLKSVLVENLLWAGLGIAVVSCLFLFHPGAVLILVGVMAVILFEIYGLLHAFELKMNGVAIVNLIVAIGVSVEFTAHVVRAFMTSRGARHERAAEALAIMLVPVSAGAASTLLGVSVLAFAAFPYYVLYYFRMFVLIVLVGYANGVLLLPVVLSLVGPAHLSVSRSASSGKIGDAASLEMCKPGMEPAAASGQKDAADGQRNTNRLATITGSVLPQPGASEPSSVVA